MAQIVAKLRTTLNCLKIIWGKTSWVGVLKPRNIKWISSWSKKAGRITKTRERVTIYYSFLRLKTEQSCIWIPVQGFQTITTNNLSVNFWNMRRKINKQELLKIWVWKIKLLFQKWLSSYSWSNTFIFVLCTCVSHS